MQIGELMIFAFGPKFTSFTFDEWQTKNAKPYTELVLRCKSAISNDRWIVHVVNRFKIKTTKIKSTFNLPSIKIDFHAVDANQRTQQQQQQKFKAIKFDVKWRGKNKSRIYFRFDGAREYSTYNTVYTNCAI